jgi:hypothetical protein
VNAAVGDELGDETVEDDDVEELAADDELELVDETVEDAAALELEDG